MTLGSTQPASDVTGSSTCLNANACVPKKAPQMQISALRRVFVQRACPELFVDLGRGGSGRRTSVFMYSLFFEIGGKWGGMFTWHVRENKTWVLHLFNKTGDRDEIGSTKKNAGLVKKEFLTDANPSLNEYFNLRQVRCYGYQMLIVNTFRVINICLPFWNVCNNEYCTISCSRLNNHVKII